MRRTTTDTTSANKTLAYLLLAATALTVLALALVARPALAATITVTATADDVINNGNCTLREAVIAANTDAARDLCPAGDAGATDVITVPAGTYTIAAFEPAPPGDSSNATVGDLDITGPTTIRGAGARTTIVQGAPVFNDRIFETSAPTTITGLTITGGKPTSGLASGGGILHTGVLTLDEVAVTGNRAFSAGGIFGLLGTLTITDSTVSGNQASDNVVGGIHLLVGTANITNSTISGNRAGRFGGVLAESDATINIRSSTIADNTSTQPGGAINTFGTGAVVNVKNSIVSNNSTTNCDTTNGGTVTSLGNNISGDNSCPFSQPTDKTNTDPFVGLLANNGGPTNTHALFAGSPAIDAGSGCPPTDQRGVKRPQGPRCDVGAFEKAAPPNRNPVARNDSYSGKEDKTLRVTTRRGVLRNDSDADRDALRTALISRPKKGKLTLGTNGALTFKPRKDFHGTVRFVYRASDGRGGSDTATVTLRIQARPR